MRTTLARLWSWLTTSCDCAWCQRRFRQAMIPIPRTLPGGKRVERVSHTICPRCFKAHFAPFAQPNAQALPNP